MTIRKTILTNEQKAKIKERLEELGIDWKNIEPKIHPDNPQYSILTRCYLEADARLRGITTQRKGDRPMSGGISLNQVLAGICDE